MREGLSLLKNSIQFSHARHPSQARPACRRSPGGTASKHQHRRSSLHALAKRASCVLTSCRLQSARCSDRKNFATTFWRILARPPPCIPHSRYNPHARQDAVVTLRENTVSDRTLAATARRSRCRYARNNRSPPNLFHHQQNPRRPSFPARNPTADHPQSLFRIARKKRPREPYGNNLWRLRGPTTANGAKPRLPSRLEKCYALFCAGFRFSSPALIALITTGSRSLNSAST